MSLLTTCQSVILQTGAGVSPAAVVSSTDMLLQQLLAWAKEEVDLLWRKHNWQALVAEHTITTAASTESYALPSDWGRYVSRTFWDATNYWPMRGSIDPSRWTALKRGIVSNPTARKEFRVKAGLVYIIPTPTAVETLIGEYIINTPVASSGGTKKATFTADDDTMVVPEHLVRLGLKWRLLRRKGFDYTEEMAEYERMVALAIAQDTPADSINFGTRTNEPPFAANLPQQIPT